MTPLKAIKQFCFECCGESFTEVKRCSAPKCVLYPYRLGHNPDRPTRKLSDEERALAAQRLQLARERKRQGDSPSN